MKKHWIDILLILVFLIGLSVLLYPVISNYINEQHQAKAIITYDDTISKKSKEELERLWAEAVDYNERISKYPISLADPKKVSGYDEALNVTGDGMMGYIYIPKINSVLAIDHGVDESTLQNFIGHMEGSSLPIGGEGSHAILMGHRGLPSAKLFSDLDKLEVGDTFSINVLDKVLNYEVDDISIVLPKEVENLYRVSGKDYVTLVTCTPYGVNTHRLLVRGHRVADDIPVEEQVYAPSDAIRRNSLLMAPLVAIPVVVLLFICNIAYKKIFHRGKKK